MMESYKEGQRYKELGNIAKAREHFFRGLKNTEALKKNCGEETDELLEVLDMYIKYIELGDEIIEGDIIARLCCEVQHDYDSLIEEEMKEEYYFIPLEWYEKRLKIQKILARIEHVPESYFRLVQMYREVAYEYQILGEDKRAEECHRECLETMEKRAIDENPELLKYLSDAYFEFGLFYDNQNYYQEALEKYDCSLKLKEDFFKKDGTMQGCEELITIYDNMAKIYKVGQYWGKALKLYQKGLIMIESVQAPNEEENKRKLRSVCYSNMAQLYSIQGFNKKADKYFKM